MPVGEVGRWLEPGPGGLEESLAPIQRVIAAEVVKELRGRVGFLLNVGLHYLTLERSAPTLSGGETQRIRLAGQIGCGLVGVLYVLDEPSIGLHPRDNDRLLRSLERLRDLGNTVVVVEHDEDTMRTADYLVDFGPGPGVRGGEVVAAGTYAEVADNPNSLTGQYLTGAKRIAIPERRRPPGPARLTVVGARHHNLKNVTVEVPLGVFVGVTGVSGSGKSSLINDILMRALLTSRERQRAENDDDDAEETAAGRRTPPGDHDRILGAEQIDKVIDIDQSPIGRTPRSNPATYIKVFDEIRSLFAGLPEAKVRGYKPGRFSFNKPGGRCEACEGAGSNRLNMDFLADVWMTCPVCEGRRFNRETLQVRFKSKSIRDVLEMDVQEALLHFQNVPRIRPMLQTLHDVGLDYIKLGQPAPTLSGGEAQRVKLAKELCRRATGRTLYVLDEPTTGLHFDDVNKLLQVLHGFVDAGNTVLVIEHNLDVIKTADWLIDLGPEGGAEGGEVVAVGTPEEVAANERSYTGKAHAADSQREGHEREADQGEEGGEIQGGHAVAAGNAHGPGGEPAQPQERDGRSAARTHVGLLRSQRFRQEFAGAGHHLCGGPKALHRIAVGLRPAVPRPDAEAEGGPRQRSVAGRQHRAEGGQQKPAFDRRHRHGGLRLPAHPLRPPRPAALPGLRYADRHADRRRDHRQGASPAGGDEALFDGPAGRRGQEKYETIWDEIRRSGFVRMRVDGKSYNVEEPPAIDHRRKHLVEVVVDRVVVRANQRTRIADAVEASLDLGRGVMHVAFVDDKKSEPDWRVDKFSLHFACDNCGRSFEPLNPHHFSFNSPLGWCPRCEGLGVQQGAPPALLLRDPRQSLRDGRGGGLAGPARGRLVPPLRRGDRAPCGFLARHAV